MQTRGALFAQTGSDRAGVNARFEQGFVGVDVSHAAQEGLIQQQRLDARLALLQEAQKILQPNVQRVRTQRLRAPQQARSPLDPSEMPDIVVNQQAFIQLENGSRVRAGLGIEQQLAGHSQMNRQYAVVQLQHNELAMPSNGFYKLIANAPPQRGKCLPN